MNALDNLLQSGSRPTGNSKGSKRRSRQNRGMPDIVNNLGQYEKMLEPYLRQHGISPDVMKPPRNKREARKQQRAVKKLFDSLDPQSKKLVEEFLGGQDLDKLLSGQSL